MRNKLGFLWVAGVFALALVFGACDTGDYDVTMGDPTTSTTTTFELSLDKKKSWTATKTATPSGGTAVVTKMSGNYIKVDSTYYFYFGATTTVDDVFVPSAGVYGQFAFKGYKSGKIFVINGQGNDYALKNHKSIGGDYIEVILTGEFDVRFLLYLS